MPIYKKKGITTTTAGPKSQVELGERYGQLIVIEKLCEVAAYATKQGYTQVHKYARCRCDCGKEKLIRWNHLRTGATTSCGCARLAALHKANVTHGKSHSRIYNCWANIYQRCNNPNNKRFKRYGGRGIKLCERWQSFANFYADVGDPPEENSTLDRIDNDGDYCQKNCQWVSNIEQQNNRSDTVYAVIDGEKCQLLSLIRESGIDKLSPKRVKVADLK